MRLLRRRNVPLTAAAARDPLAAVPLAADGVSVESATPEGALVLARRLTPRSRLHARLARLLRHNLTVRLSLDERGGFFWRQMDGKRSLRRIAEALQPQFALSRDAARQATVLFVKELMKRGFLNLRIEGEAGLPR